MLEEFEHSIEELVIVPSSGGVFEIDVDGERVYSKKATGRHVEPEEVLKVVRKKV